MREQVLERIRAAGPMPFDAFMELCLYDPDGGFFAAGDVRSGTDADFVTSPEISPWFGRLMGRWALEAHPSESSMLVEVGGGSGSLLGPLVDEAGSAFPSIAAVEVSEQARRSIEGRVPAATVVQSIRDLPTGADAVVVVNELLDNLPARLVERTPAGWREMLVGESGGRFEMVSVEADLDLSAWCDERLGVVPEGSVLTAQMGVELWLRELLAHFASVRLLVVDYAASTPELAERRSEDIVRSFARQRSGNDVLVKPGSTDITVDVNTDVVVSVAESLGATVSVTDQRSFLMELGAREVLEDLLEFGHERAREGDVMGQLVAKSEATGLRALLNPAGLGGFTVLSISSGT